MEDLRGQASIRQKLKNHFFSCGAMAVLFLAALSVALVLNRYVNGLDSDVEGLRRVKASLFQVPQTVTKANAFFNHASALIPSDIRIEPPAHFLCIGLDRVKNAVNDGRLTTGKMEDKGEETLMAITLSGNLRDYQAFITGLGHLQSMRFPFFVAKGLTLKANREDRNGIVATYEIRGDLTTPKPTQGEEDPSSRGRGRRN